MSMPLVTVLDSLVVSDTLELSEVVEAALELGLVLAEDVAVSDSVGLARPEGLGGRGGFSFGRKGLVTRGGDGSVVSGLTAVVVSVAGTSFMSKYSWLSMAYLEKDKSAFKNIFATSFSLIYAHKS